MKIKKAKNSWIQIEQVKETTKKPSLLMQQNVEEDFSYGKIISIGEGVQLIDGRKTTGDFQVGDIVIYLTGTGKVIKDQEKEYIFVYATSIICTCEE